MGGGQRHPDQNPVAHVRQMSDGPEDPSASTSTFQPLPRVDGSTLTYETFLRDFALPRQPCIITNLGSEWEARRWCVDHFLGHDGVDLNHKVYAAEGLPKLAKEIKTTVGKALKKVAAAEASHPYYLSAWNYLRGGSSGLAREFEVPRIFERAPSWLSNHVVLGNAATDMKWLYIGSQNSGSATHVDTNLSSAWLWVAQGRKEWVCAHGGDHAILTAGTGSRAYGYKADDDDDDEAEPSVPLPDFFADDLFERWPQCQGARLYRGFQEAGEVCFNPSMCVHAVRNVAEGVTVSLTHNFVDASNLADVLSDAERSIRTELLPMAAELKPKSVIKTLAKTLGLPKEELAATLATMPDLLSGNRMEELIACAAKGAEADGGAEAVASLLRTELDERLKSVRPAFEKAATALRDALALCGESEAVAVT